MVKKETDMRMWDEFKIIVEKHFNYLETEFGFRQVSFEVPFIIYESPFLCIRIFWEYGGRYELDLGIESKNESKNGLPSISLGMLAQLYKPKKDKNFEWLLIKTKEQLDSGVRELAELLRKYGTNLLRGDFHELDTIHKLEKKAAKRYSK
jgi:hypothetical protein